MVRVRRSLSISVSTLPLFARAHSCAAANGESSALRFALALSQPPWQLCAGATRAARGHGRVLPLRRRAAALLPPRAQGPQGCARAQGAEGCRVSSKKERGGDGRGGGRPIRGPGRVPEA